MNFTKSLASTLVLLVLAATASATEVHLSTNSSTATSGLAVFNPELADAIDELDALLDVFAMLNQEMAQLLASRPVLGKPMSKSEYEKALKKWAAAVTALQSKMEAVQSKISAVEKEIDYLTR